MREGLAQLLGLPEGYEVLLGNGGTTALWDALAFGMVRERALHLTYGEFSSKFAKVTAGAPFLADPVVIESEPGDRARSVGSDDSCDVVAWAHNETSTGVMLRRRRARPATRWCWWTPPPAPAACRCDAAERRRLLLRPAEVLRRRRRHLVRRAAARRRSSGSRRSAASDRWIPDFLSLTTALENSRKDQTYNTPGGGHPVAAGRAGRLDERRRRPAGVLRGPHPGVVLAPVRLGRGSSEFATPFVAEQANRSLVVGTIDFDDSVDAAAVAATLRANGIVDTEPYRKLGRNQLRIGMFPAVEPDDVRALTACIDYVVEAQS